MTTEISQTIADLHHEAMCRSGSRRVADVLVLVTLQALSQSKPDASRPSPATMRQAFAEIWDSPAGIFVREGYQTASRSGTTATA